MAGVDSSSDAGSKGFERGDVLLSINNTPITSVGEVENGIRAAQSAGRSAVGVQWMRPGQPPIYVGIRLR